MTRPASGSAAPAPDPGAAPRRPRASRRASDARLIAPLALTLATAGALATIAVRSPEEPGHYPSCPFRSATGLYCPGCGSLRALHALANGDLGTALDRNVLTVALVPVAVVAWFGWLRRHIADRPARPLPAAWLWTALATAVFFGVIRNLPFGSWLAP